MKKINTILLTGLTALVAACSSDKENTLPPVVTGNFVSAITITNGDILLPDIGDTDTVQVAATPADADGVGNYEFRSGNTKVFTVTQDGVIIATGYGEATLSMIAKNNVSVKTSCKVTVVGTRITAIALPSGGLSALYPNNIDMRAAATITPSDASIQTLNFTSSNLLAATVNENGIVRPVWEGVTTITATATDGSGVSATCEVTVNIIPVTSIIFGDITLNLISNVIANNATSGTLHVNTRCNLLGNDKGNPDIILPKSGTSSSTNTIVYLPDTASRNILSYTSSAPTIINVASDENNSLVMKPQQNSPGTATVFIKATDGYDAAATLTIVNHAVYARTGWSIVDHSPDSAYLGEGGPIENVISDENVAASLVKPDEYNGSPQGFTESYFVVDLGAPTKFDYMLTEATQFNLPNDMYRINRVSLYGSDTFNDALTSWTAIQENITVNHVGYFAPIQLNQLSTYRYVKVVVWNTDKMYSKYYPIWIIKNFWLGSAE